MAAASPLSPEELLLPKGGPGKAEELEEELEEDDDEVPSHGAGSRGSVAARGLHVRGRGDPWAWGGAGQGLFPAAFHGSDSEPPPQLDETLSERLWGLTEMFPESVRTAAGATFDLSLSVAQSMYR